MSETWIILGASSSMARALVRALAAQGAALVLAGRDLDDLNATAGDARLRGAESAQAVRFDARDPSTFPDVIAAAGDEGLLNVAVFVGSMPPQPEIDADPSLIGTTVTDTFAGPAQFLTLLAPRLEEQGAGTIVGLGSVAGDRGRLGNYVYGAAKAGFHTYLAGLRNRLGRSGVHVMTVKPGFVDTAMTWGIEGMFLVASPDRVARDILRGVRRRRNVIYTPAFWMLIMAIIRLIPEPVFKKMKI